MSGLFILLPTKSATRRRCRTKTTSNKAQRPAFLLLLHCEGFFSPPSFPWSSHKSRAATGSALRHRSPSVATAAATGSIVEALASHLALQPHANATISTRNPRCFTHQTLQCPQSTPTAPPLPHLDYCTNPLLSF